MQKRARSSTTHTARSLLGRPGRWSAAAAAAAQNKKSPHRAPLSPSSFLSAGTEPSAQVFKRTPLIDPVLSLLTQTDTPPPRAFCQARPKEHRSLLLLLLLLFLCPFFSLFRQYGARVTRARKRNTRGGFLSIGPRARPARPNARRSPPPCFLPPPPLLPPPLARAQPRALAPPSIAGRASKTSRCPPGSTGGHSARPRRQRFAKRAIRARGPPFLLSPSPALPPAHSHSAADGANTRPDQNTSLRNGEPRRRRRRPRVGGRRCL